MSYKEYNGAKPQCPECNNSLQRIISRVRVARSEDSRLDAMSDPTSLGGVDENDPKSVGKFMRRMGHEMGEEMGPEFDEMVGRLESGEDPESIGSDLPDVPGGAPNIHP